jgi:hypothetical protein
MDGISVYKARLAMGEALADQVIRSFGKNMDIDVVIPVKYHVATCIMYWLISVIRSLIQAVLPLFSFLVN